MNAHVDRIGNVYVVLAVMTLSTTPVLIRWASALSPLVVTCLRMLVGLATVLLVASVRGQKPSLLRDDWPRFAVWGLVTALHFGLYIALLGYTTVAHSLALVYTSPIWVSLFTWILLKEPLPGCKWNIRTYGMPERMKLSLLSILLLGEFPLGIGDTLYNAALRPTHPTQVNVIAPQEVTGGILLVAARGGAFCERARRGGDHVDRRGAGDPMRLG